jgi:hypothetical protein
MRTAFGNFATEGNWNDLAPKTMKGTADDVISVMKVESDKTAKQLGPIIAI